MEQVTLFMAFTAGVISFLSPCVLPLVPGYVSYLSGVSVNQMQAAAGGDRLSGRARSRLMIGALLFVTGFTIIFVVLGATATALGAFISTRMDLLTKAAGAVIIFFGLFKLGLIRWLFLFKERRLQPRDNALGLAGAVLLGAAFAFGWTPCVGPILGAILMYAGTLGQVQQGIVLLLVYSLGLGIPFILMAAAIGSFMRFFKWLKRWTGVLEKISGAVMVVLGVMIWTNTLILIPGYLGFLNRFAL